jgi:hypothetical protein
MHDYPHPQRAPYLGVRVGYVGRGIGSGTNNGIGIPMFFYEGLNFWFHIGSLFFSSFVSFALAYLCSSNRMMMMGYFFDTSPTDPSPFSSTFLDSD